MSSICSMTSGTGPAVGVNDVLLGGVIVDKARHVGRTHSQEAEEGKDNRASVSANFPSGQGSGRKGDGNPSPGSDEEAG